MNRLVEQEVEFTKKLTQRITQSPAPKDDDAFYGELFTSNLRQLSEIQRLQPKHEIVNIMFKYLLVWEESTTRNTLESSTNQICSKR